MESDIYVEECLACPQQLFTALQQTENEKSASFVDGYFTLKCFNRDTREGFHISFTSWMCFLYLFIHRLAYFTRATHTHKGNQRDGFWQVKLTLCLWSSSRLRASSPRPCKQAQSPEQSLSIPWKHWDTDASPWRQPAGALSRWARVSGVSGWARLSW